MIERLHICPTCNNDFAVKETMKKHITNVHEGKKCEIFKSNVNSYDTVHERNTVVHSVN